MCRHLRQQQWAAKGHRQASDPRGRCFFSGAQWHSHSVTAHGARTVKLWIDQGGKPMRSKLAALLGSVAFVANSGAVLAHHSFAMFDQENPVELSGTVKEFKFTSPHTFILLQVNGPDGAPVVWNLEGASP